MTVPRPRRLRLLVAAIAGILMLTGSTLVAAASPSAAQLANGSGAPKPTIVLVHGPSPTPAAGTPPPAAS